MTSAEPPKPPQPPEDAVEPAAPVTALPPAPPADESPDTTPVLDSSPREKSPALATVLAFVPFGLGHLYLGLQGKEGYRAIGGWQGVDNFAHQRAHTARRWPAHTPTGQSQHLCLFADKGRAGHLRVSGLATDDNKAVALDDEIQARHTGDIHDHRGGALTAFALQYQVGAASHDLGFTRMSSQHL